MIEIGKIKEGMTGRQVADLLYDNFLAVISGLGEYATEKWVTDKGYITEASLNGYATEKWVLDKGYITEASLNGYATEQWVTGRGYITASAVAKGYATIASLNELADGVSESLAAVNTALAERVEKTKFAEYFSTEMAKWFIKDDTNKGVKPANGFGFYSESYISAKGVSTGTGGSGGSSYDRLDRWSDYTSGKAGWVLSALLGYDLHTRVNNLANAGYITASALSGYAKLSDIPTSLPASDVAAWAKAASKPSYAFSEITNKPTTLGGYGITDAYTATTIDGKLSAYQPLSTAINTGNIGSQSVSKANFLARQATLTTDTIDSFLSTDGIQFSLISSYAAPGWVGNDGMIISVPWTNLTYGAQIAIDDQSNYVALRAKSNGVWKDWRVFAFTDSNVASATKLQTPRTIWGQSFDGTGDVSGKLTGVTQIQNAENKGIYLWSNTYSSNYPTNSGNLGTGVGIGLWSAYGTFIWGTGNGNGHIQVGRSDGTNTSYNLLLQEFGGNVGIGTTSPTEKLHVAGNIVATGSVTAKSISDYRLKCAFDYNVDYQERLLSLGKVCDFNYTPHAQKREFAFADDKRHTSVIWQDARKANITGFCSVEEDGYGTINPLSSDLIFTMVGAIQQGIVKTERIEERVVRLEKENRELKEKINLLEGGSYGC